jgi:hypothetical protein
MAYSSATRTGSGRFGDDRTEAEEAGVLGLARQHGQHLHRRDGEAGRGGVVLVDHDVHADLVGEHVLVEILVHQAGHHDRVGVLAGDVDAQIAGVLVPGGVIALFGEVPDVHGSPPYEAD